MPYKRTYRRRPYRKGRKLGRRQKRQVKVLIARRQELKYSYYANSTTVDSVGFVTGTPFDIPQGDTDTSRDGDRLQWCGKIDLMLHCINGQGALGDVYNNIRVIIFQYHPNSTPGLSTILLAGPSGSQDVLSLYNHDNRQEYRILFDRVFKTVGNANAATTPATNTVATNVRKFKIPLRKIRKYAQYTGGTLAGTNRIYIAYLSDSSAATHPTLEYSTKVFFRDS